MDAVKFLLETERMCKAHKGCNECPLNGKRCLSVYEHSEYTGKEAKELVSLVGKWSKEHPVKTNLDYLKEIFPNYVRDQNGIPLVCPASLGIVRWETILRKTKCTGIPVMVCDRREFCAECWHLPYEESK